MKTHMINGKDYYFVEDLFKTDHRWFKGCNEHLRKIVKIRRIPKSKHVYAVFNEKDEEWKVYDASYTRAKLYIDKLWIHENHLRFRPYEDESDDEDSDTEAIGDLLFVRNYRDSKIEVRGKPKLTDAYVKIQDMEYSMGIPGLCEKFMKKDVKKDERGDYVSLEALVKIKEEAFDGIKIWLIQELYK